MQLIEMDKARDEEGSAAGAARLASSETDPGSCLADKEQSGRIGSNGSALLGVGVGAADVELLHKNRPDGQGNVGQILKWIEMKVRLTVPAQSIVRWPVFPRGWTPLPCPCT